MERFLAPLRTYRILIETYYVYTDDVKLYTVVNDERQMATLSE